MTHNELVERAERWLHGQGFCATLTEPYRGGEQPDAIGWNYRGVSAAVECKVSLSDWRSDKRKESKYRQCGRLGQFRWYLVTPELAEQAPPLPVFWGLLVCHPKQVRKIVKARRQPLMWLHHDAECQLILRTRRPAGL